MKTQELKQYIDRVLGNSIRCLLPSYWWKRAFGAVIDNTISKDEVKTINGESILGEGDLRVGVKSVESVEALEKLDAVVGDIASVGVESLEVVSAADLKESDSATFLDEWDSLTRIYKVELGEPFSEEGRHVVVMLHSKKQYLYDGIMLRCENGEFTCALFSYGDVLMKSIDEINERLQNGDYRYLSGSYPDVIDKTYKLYVKESSADAYIKGDSWARLLKEGDVTGGGSVIFSIPLSGDITDITENQRNRNIESYQKVIKAFEDNIVLDIKIDQLFISNVSLYVIDVNNNIVAMVFNRDNSVYTYRFSSDGNFTREIEEGSALEIDSELSDTSENAVQNKAVKAYIDNAITNTLNTEV